MKDGLLTIEEAYMAMYYFLGIDYSRGASDEIGGLLGSLNWSMTANRSPMDAGAWDDWLSAVRMAVENQADGVKNMASTYAELIQRQDAS